MEKNIVIIHYNTPLLTECLVHSINHFTPNTNIYIFDNSNKNPFTSKFDNVTIIDNTKGQIVNFDNWINSFPNRVKQSHNNYASAKHCYSVQKCIDIIQKNFVLLDSDVLLKRDITDFFIDDNIYVGETKRNGNFMERVTPFICFINVKMLIENNISYFNGEYMHQLSIKNNSFDTGAYFYLKSKKLKHRDININNYIIHFKAASWKENANKKNINEFRWLLNNKNLWCFENVELLNKISKKCSVSKTPKISAKTVLRKNTRKSHLLRRRERIIRRRIR